VRTGTRSGETPAAISLNGIQVKRTVQEHHDLEADPSRSDTVSLTCLPIRYITDT
jgi:hypothetical protein